MNKAIGNFLTEQLYPDLKNWLPSLYKKMETPIRKLNAPTYHSPKELLDALKANQIKPNSWVTLECKPSLFGPYLRDHFLAPIIGSNSNMRLGPRIVADDPIMAIMGQTWSHLKPVGIYPPIGDDLYQTCLYPQDSSACGMISLIPGISKMVEYIPAISNSQNLTFCGVSCNARGIIRQVDPKLLIEAGIPIEKYEELRQSGDIWFLDLSSEESEIEPHYQATTLEMWGGLYASGRIEIRDGQLNGKHIILGMCELYRQHGFEPHTSIGEGKVKNTLIYSKGIRTTISHDEPCYSIHMDAEIGLQYGEYKRKFDSICEGNLKNIIDAARDDSVDLANPNDLDFSYTDSTNAYSILKSLGSEHIADPVGIAIRDWHRKRGN